MEEYLNQAILNKSYTDKWILIFPVPTILKDIDNHQIKNIMNDEKRVSSDMFFLSIEKATVPSVKIPAITAKYAGQSLKTSSHVREPYDNVSVQFTIDNRFSNYYFIYAWLNVLNGQRGATWDEEEFRNSYEYDAEIKDDVLKMMKNYQVDADLVLLDEYNKPIVTFKLSKLFPTSLGDIDINYQEANRNIVSAEFAFSQMTLEIGAPEGISTYDQPSYNPLPIQTEESITSMSSETLSSTTETTTLTIEEVC